jgi:hypothetical protein
MESIRLLMAHRSSGTRPRENINDLVAAAHQEERTAAFGDANKSDPVGCCPVISSGVIAPPPSAIEKSNSSESDYAVRPRIGVRKK